MSVIKGGGYELKVNSNPVSAPVDVTVVEKHDEIFLLSSTRLTVRKAEGAKDDVLRGVGTIKTNTCEMRILWTSVIYLGAPPLQYYDHVGATTAAPTPYGYAACALQSRYTALRTPYNLDTHASQEHCFCRIGSCILIANFEQIIRHT